MRAKTKGTMLPLFQQGQRAEMALFTVSDKFLLSEFTLIFGNSP